MFQLLMSIDVDMIVNVSGGLMGMIVLKIMKARKVAKRTRQIDEIHERVLTCRQIVGGKVQEQNTWAKFDGVSCFRS